MSSMSSETMVSTGSIICDTLFFLKNALSGNVPDPITRPSGDKFIMTSFPSRASTYPLITIKDNGITATKKLGFQSEGFQMKLPIEVRIWARSVAERDKLFDRTFEVLRTNQFPVGTSGTSSYADLHDFKLESVNNFDEAGENSIKCKIINLSYMYVVDA